MKKFSLRTKNRRPAPASQLHPPENVLAKTMPAIKPTKDSGVSDVTNPTQTPTHEEVIPSDDDATQINSDDILRIQEELPLLDYSYKQPATAAFWEDEPLNLVSPPVKPQTAEVQVQTDSLLPMDENTGALVAKRQVEVLQGVLRARSWAIDKEKCKRLRVTDLLQGEALFAEAKKEHQSPAVTSTLNESLDANGRQIEMIDLRSSSQQTDCIQPTPMDSVQTFPNSHTYGGESLRYSLLHPCAEEPVADAFRTVLNYVEEQVLTNAQNAVDYWSGSFLESAVEVLLLTADIEGSLSCQMLVTFCMKLLDIICTTDHFNQGNICEHYSNIALKISESTVVSFNIIDPLLRKLLELQDLIDGGGYAAKDNVHVLEASYYVIKMLSIILSRIEKKSKEGSMAEIIHNLSTSKKANKGVLNLWRRHWRPAELDVAPVSQFAQNTKFGIWMERLETVLRSAILRAPILSPSIMKCVEILKKLEE